jgi:hypothetical protein
VYIRLYYKPLVNVVYDFKCSSLAIFDVEILVHPHDQVIFEGTFNELMKEIR